MSAAPADRRRVRARVEGTVQGVGFRPFVFRLASELGLGGWVLNDERGVLVEAEGPGAEVDAFLARLPVEAPRLASVGSVTADPLAVTGEASFRILVSEGGGPPDAPVSPDAATCEDCLAELNDSADRRHRYPFTNCTNCGPRFTIVRGVPYDRALTTMAGFEMCDRCRAEYEDPADRRFHAQPNACPDCGPRARLVDARGRDVPVDDEADAVAVTARELLAGRIVAIKGIGGYHLCCRADDEAAVATLRSRKHREDKPFALMAASVEAAGELIELDPAEKLLMGGLERPIVVARRAQGAGRVAGSVAPGKPDLGVMLPYSPLHHLLAADAGVPLVMTSGNVSDEPVAFRDEDAFARLGAIADLFLVHDRPIEMRTDDSVVRSTAAGRLMLRRSRGYVPNELMLPDDAPPLLACGAEQKSTFCLARGRRAWVGHHIGDLENYETLSSFVGGVEHFQRLFAVEPELVVHDMHPEYLSTKYALEREGVSHLAVQHHHAHLAACLAEHGEAGPAIGAIYDGTGYGPDGTIWGGELLAGGVAGFERAGMLWPARLPGGAASVREPWRMACAWLVAASGETEPAMPPAFAGIVEGVAWDQVCELVKTGVASPPTTSMGRLFDALAALCGLRPRVTYEGQAAVELEAAADLNETGAYPVALLDARPGEGEEAAGSGGALLVDVREMVGAVRDDAAARRPLGLISARIHNALASATAEALAAEGERRGIDTAVLAGGVFQNRLLMERTIDALAPSGLRVLAPRALPPNDGAISFGQAAVAAATGA